MSKVAKIWLEPLQGYDPWKDSEEFYFDQQSAENACKIFPEYFKHKEGEFAGQPFYLEDWEKKIVGHIFGWKRKSNNTRRYRRAFIYLPKKNGKTALVAGIAMIMLVFDNEFGAKVFTASGDQTQANIMFEAATFSVENHDELSEAIEVTPSYKLMSFTATESYWKVLSSNAKTKHGPNISALFLDELHVFPENRGKLLIETLEAGTMSRRQPLIVYTTTADYSRPSPCNEIYDYAKKIRDGIIPDPFFLPVIYEADDEKDDWTKEETWKKANPNYGISVPRDFFVAEVQRAKDNPSIQNAFKRLHLNMQTKQEKKWMDMIEWDASGAKIEKDELLGKTCYGALDLSSTRDISAFVLLFPDYLACLCWFWAPRKTAEKRIEYEKWAGDGYIELTEGAVVDYEAIRTRVAVESKKYNIVEIEYDPWNATQIVNKMKNDDGLPMQEFRQGFKSMNEPTKELEKSVVSHKLIHFGNPVLRWMVSNANTLEDAAGNVKLIKPHKDSPQKVDGIVALVMAYGKALTAIPQGKSVFSSKEEEMDKILKEIYGK
jgi:phage terminase large subunit-like protein